MNYECRITDEAPRFWGGAHEMFLSTHPQVILEGPYESGKTFPCLWKLHAFLATYPQAKGLMIRKTYTDLVGAIQDMWEEQILPMNPDDPRAPVTRFGGANTPKVYNYPNGSKVVLKGLDKANKLLSGAYDYIYVCQAEELTLDEWESLTSRCTPRVSTKRKVRPPYTQMIADCNPDSNLHWIINRHKDNPDADPFGMHKIYTSRLKDNPTVWSTPWDHRTLAEGGEGDWTPDGRRSYAFLSTMSGVRYKRGFLGQWVAAEGQVYEFFSDQHVINEMPMGWERWRKVCSVDFGHNDPFVYQWWAIAPNQDMYLYREIYARGGEGKSMNYFSRKIKDIERKNRERISFRVADHDKGLQEILMDHGIRTKDADKRIELGIQEVENRLNQENDTPNMYFLADALVERDRELHLSRKPSSTIGEFAEYVYKDSTSSARREVPKDEFNHGMDAMRYAAMALSARGRSMKGFRHSVSRL